MNNAECSALAGPTARLVAQHDWSMTALGPRAGWSARLQALADVVVRSPVPSALLWGPEGILLYNDGYAVICGRKHPAALGQSALDVWPEARAFNAGVIAAGQAGQTQVFEGARFMLERDGELRESWFDLYYAPVVDDAGNVEGVLATVIETTDQVHAAQERERQATELRRLNVELDGQRARLEAANQQLAGNMAFLNELFQRSPSFMAVLLGPEHRFELTNASYDALIQNRAVHGLPLREALPEVAAQGFIALLDSVYETGVAYHGENLQVMLDRGDGTVERRILDFIYQPLKDDAGQTYGVFVEGIDVTAHALAEERLRVAQEAGEVGTFEWYPDSAQLVVSDSYRRLWGIPPDTPVTQDLLVGMVEPAWRGVSGVARLGQMSNPLEYVEYPVTHGVTGERRWIARQGQLVPQGPDQEPRYLGVIYDVTDRKAAEQALRDLNESLERRVSSEVAERMKAEDALRHAQKMEAVGQLASGVAHDFNNVLQIISSNLQLMDLELGASPQLRARLGHAIAAVERGSKLSFQLLAFARHQPLQPVVTDLTRLLRDMVPLLQRALGDGIALHVDAPLDLWGTSVDRYQLENAVLNLAINARDAMQGSGRLDLVLCNDPSGPHGGQVCLTVSDTGCGMPPEVAAKVFEPFYTTKEPGKGTGLGLSMVYGFVRQSGGEIHVDSAPGQGTRIRIALPRADGVHAAAAPEPRVAPLRGDETILLVEDDPAVRSAASDLLVGLGYRVLTANNGEQALDVLRGAGRVDLLFTDVSMPGRVDSAELVCRTRASLPDTAILLTSGHALDRSLLDPRMPASIELLPKPYSLAQLAATVRQQLDAPRSPAAGVAGAFDATPEAAARLHFLVVEDDRDACELACEILAALGCRATGVASAEEALELLQRSAFDVLLTDFNLAGMRGDQLAVRASTLQPQLAVIVSSGEGTVPVALPHGAALQLPKPYDLMQLQGHIDTLQQARALAAAH